MQAISAVADAPDDRELLRAHEPVLRYTEGELFLPIAVGPYVTQCSLWEGGRERAAAPLVPAGELTLDRLGELGARFRDRPLYLRFVQRQLDRHEVRAWRRADRPRLRGAARFAAVGVLARLIDVVLRISLLVRGRVPGGLVAAADRASRTHLGADRCPYYGRVVRAEGYTVLQYWYFYPFNDWRSTFHGVNDHEADWEMVAVYLVGDADRLRPAWVAASAREKRPVTAYAASCGRRRTRSRSPASTTKSAPMDRPHELGDETSKRRLRRGGSAGCPRARRRTPRTGHRSGEHCRPSDRRKR